MQKVFTLNKLATSFYTAYPANKFPEIESKPSRPYVVLVIEIQGNRFALPFRTNIRHKFCYKFKNTNRATDSASGIDFSKAVIVNDDNFIGDETQIDNKEYVELANKFYFVIKKFTNYLNGYIEFRTQGGDEFAEKKYQYTTLRYFDKDLGIAE